MVAGVYDQSVDGIVLSEARLVALKLVKCCRPRKNQGAVTYIAESFGYGCSVVGLPKVLPLLAAT